MGISYTHAQTMKKLIHTQDFENRLAKEAQTMQSIESDFTQVKYLDILDEKGIMYDYCPGVSAFCGAASALNLEYTLPNGQKVKIQSR